MKNESWIFFVGSRGSQSANNIMLGFSNPPGAVPPPSVSPATDKYDRPKEAHSSSSATAAQQVCANCCLIVTKRIKH